MADLVPCTKPLKAWRGSDGELSFHQQKGSKGLLRLACGRCIGCRLARSQAWAIRLVHEAQMADVSCFITLTYDPEKLPKDLSVDVKDWQLFAKRLRKRMGPFRFFHCGEYGELNKRPHYHACLFGVNFESDRILWTASRKEEHKRWTSDTLSGVWGKGFCTISELNYQTAAYAARYVVKKMGGIKALEAYTRTDVETGEQWMVKPEYASMSLRPGLGRTWFEKFSGDVFPDDFVVLDGKKMKVPTYYDLLYEKQDKESFERIKAKRREFVIAQGRHEQSPERLEVKEEVLRRRLMLTTRRI